jgi:LysM repeat protein
MKLKVRLSIILSFIFVFYLINSVESQVVVERSKDKVTISGKPYYIHVVKKGETVYSISRAYGISEIELTQQNPSALYGVKENQSLKIPVVESLVTNVVAHDETKYTYHKLGPGDTIYSLSKKYDVSEDQIISSNPNLDIYNLSVGTEIAIPKKQLMTVQQNFENQNESFFFYKVEKGESMSSIARKYGITVRELRKENNGLIFPKVNDYIRIPKTNLVQETVNDVIKVDTAIVVDLNEDITTEKPVAFTSLGKLKGSINVALLLPFYLNENSKRTEIALLNLLREREFIKM